MNLRTAIRLIENIQAPETSWDNLTTGQPAMFYGWRGTGGDPSRSILALKWQAKIGRKHLLGDGIYVAPTRLMASVYGDPVMVRVVLRNPYVLAHASGSDIARMPYDEIRQSHDGIVILSGRAEGNEDMRQAVIFPEYADQVEVGIEPPTFTTIQPGATVRIVHVPEVDRERRGHLLGKTGKVVSMRMGHPNVKLKGEPKALLFSKQDVEIV
jgi:hypothetical protein